MFPVLARTDVAFHKHHTGHWQAATRIRGGGWAVRLNIAQGMILF